MEEGHQYVMNPNGLQENNISHRGDFKCRLVLTNVLSSVDSKFEYQDVMSVKFALRPL